MNWASFDQFLHMGGYGLYVWGSYGATVLLMSAEALLVRHRHRLAFRAARTDDGDDADDGGEAAA
jgi:heme exporter protein D